jgi:hypothetical protein
MLAALVGFSAQAQAQLFDPVSLLPASGALPAATRGSPYSEFFIASGGPVGVGTNIVITGNYSYTVSSGSLPPGLLLNNQTGALTGTPSQSGNFAFSIQATSLVFGLNAVPASGSGVDGTSDLAAGCSLAGNVNCSTFAQNSYTLNVAEPGPVVISPTAGEVGPATEGIFFVGPSFSTTGGAEPVSFDLKPGSSFPPGMSFGKGNTLVGTPTSVGQFSFTLLAVDNLGQTDEKTYTLTVESATLTLNPVGGELGPFTTGNFHVGPVFTASGGVGPRTVAVQNGSSLPPGLTWDGTTFTGTPTQAGLYTFTLVATDANNQTASQTYTLTVNDPTSPVVLSPAAGALADGTVGTDYTQQFTVAFNGLAGTNASTPVFSYAVSGGSIPDGLTFDTQSGLLSGTPTTANTFSFSVTATFEGFTVPFSVDPGAPRSLAAVCSAGARLGCSLSVTNAYTLKIIAAPSPVALSPAAGALTAGTVGSAYPGVQLSATGGTTPYTFAVSAGSLPPGLTIDAQNAITGMPTAAGTYAFSVTVTDEQSQTDTHDYTIAIAAAATPVTLLPPDGALDPGTVGTQYPGQTFGATGGTAPYTFAVASGALPPGMAIAFGDTLTGTPTLAGNYSFSISVTDQLGQSDVNAYTLIVSDRAAPVVLAPESGALSGGTVGTAYAGVTLSASGGTAPYTIAVATGSALPPGLSIDGGNRLVGTPGADGMFSFSITATDALGATDTNDYTVIINAALSPVVLAPEDETLPPGVAGAAYSGATFTATGGVAPYTFQTSGGTVPPGLSLSPSGELTGVPTVAGTYRFFVTVIDAFTQTDTDEYLVVVSAAVTPVVLAPEDDTLPPGVAGAAYSGATFTATGGVAPYTFQTSGGTVPPGLSLSSSGELTGVPTVAGTYRFFVTVIDTLTQTDTDEYQIVVGTNRNSIAIQAIQEQGGNLVAETSSQAQAGATQQAVDDAFNGTFNMTGTTGGMQVNFAPAPKRPRAAKALDDLAFNRRALAREAAGGTLPGLFAYDDAAEAAAVDDTARLSAWTSIRATGWDTSAALNDLEGSQVNTYGGMSYRFSPSLVAGVFTGWETFDYADAGGATLDGDGFTGGVYAGYRPGNGLRFDAQVGVAAISYHAASGPVTADFDAMRIVASGGISGVTELSGFVLEPSLRALGTWEEQDAYTDSAGTAVAARSFAFGKIAAGFKASRPVVLDGGTVITPSAGIFADYRFSSGDTSALDDALDGLSARATVGFTGQFNPNVTFGLDGEVTGIGLDDALSYSGRARLGVRF